MRRPFARALNGSLVLAAVAGAIPLVSAAPVAADSIVVGGFPVDISEGPWTVALSSRDRFGGTRAGQFCGGVAVGRTVVLTAAHCLGADVLGAPPNRVRDLKVIAGRTDLLSDQGQEIPVRDTWVNPGYDTSTNAGDFAVLRLAEPLAASSVVTMASAGDAAYEPGTAAVVYGWGDATGVVTTRAVCGRHACMCWPTPSVSRRTRPVPTAPMPPTRCCAPGRQRAVSTPARGTAAGRWSPRGSWSGSCPGGAAAVARAAQASIRACPTSYGRWGGQAACGGRTRPPDGS